MNKHIKIIIVLILFFSLGALGFYGHFMEADNFEADGIVIEAKWNTRNHQMSLFNIRENNGSEKSFHFYRVTLKENEIKVGDRFVKKSKSKICNINGKSILCVE